MPKRFVDLAPDFSELIFELENSFLEILAINRHVERYIDISVNGAGADGVTLATSFAEARRASEQAACLDFFGLDREGRSRCVSGPCARFCAGESA